ncbi:MAG: hypothetical protein LBF63_04630 [Treponema sp.]|jgi:hypothetical protein|nr:hypothetical protein [Treponema sp.]
MKPYHVCEEFNHPNQEERKDISNNKFVAFVLPGLGYFVRRGYYQGMEPEYTYFEAEDGFFVGWFDDFPEIVWVKQAIKVMK